MVEFSFISRNENKLGIITLEVNGIYSTVSFELNDDNTISTINDHGDIITIEYINTWIHSLFTFINHIQSKQDSSFIIQNRLLMNITQNIFTFVITDIVFQYDLNQFYNPIMNLLYNLQSWLQKLII